MIIDSEIIAYALLFAIYYPYLCYSCYVELYTCRRRFPALRFKFFITDIWAAMIGLTPSTLLAVQAIQNSERGWWVFALAVVLPAQLAWIFQGRLTAQFDEISAPESSGPIASAFYIVAYALIAIPVAAIAVLAIATCLPAITLYATLYLRKNAAVVSQPALRKSVRKTVNQIYAEAYANSSVREVGNIPLKITTKTRSH
jgi:hypothetical protein